MRWIVLRYSQKCYASTVYRYNCTTVSYLNKFEWYLAIDRTTTFAHTEYYTNTICCTIFWPTTDNKNNYWIYGNLRP